MIMNHQSDRSQSAASLLFTFGLREGEWIQIVGKTAVIGRDPTADVQLDSPYVSRKHAEVVNEGGYWFITDLYSKNGVFKNMDRIQPGKRIPLNDRDQIQIGSASAFDFHDSEATVHESELRLMSPGLWLDEPTRDVYVYGKCLEPPLSPQQFTLLAGLVVKKGDIVTYDEIAQLLWPEAAGGIENAAIDNAISRLRDRLAELDEAHDYIETVRGIGRRFVQRKLGE